MKLTILNYGLKESASSHNVRLTNQEQLDASLSRVDLPYMLKPQERVLLGTREEVSIPLSAVGLVLLRSTAARAGLMAPPTYADAMFQGNLTLELWNLNIRHPVELVPDMYLFDLQLIHARDAQPYTMPGHRYQGQTGVTGPKALSNPGA